MPQNPIAKLNEILTTLSPYEFATLGFVIGVILSDGLNANQLNSIGNLYELIGQTILTIQAQVQDGGSISDTLHLNQAIEMLKNKIGNIEEILADFKKLS